MKLIAQIVFVMCIATATASVSDAKERIMAVRAHDEEPSAPLLFREDGRAHDQLFLFREGVAGQPALHAIDLGTVAFAMLASHAPRLASYVRGPVVLMPLFAKDTLGIALSVRSR